MLCLHVLYTTFLLLSGLSRWTYHCLLVPCPPSGSPLDSLRSCFSWLSPSPPLSLLPVQTCLFDLVQQGFITNLQITRRPLPVPARSFQSLRDQIAFGFPRCRTSRHFQRKTPWLVRKLRFYLWLALKILDGLPAIPQYCDFSG